MGKIRTLMRAGEWLLLPGESVPDLHEPQLEKISEPRAVPAKPHDRQYDHFSTPKSPRFTRGAVKAPAEHGDSAMYQRGCRCEICAGYPERYRAEKRRQFRSGEIGIDHGTSTAYCIYACRCEACIEGRRLNGERWRNKKRQATK